jgi:NAD(P)-dependent dehydrogenase (short-subunit alcohol dehydrogenase family)
MCNFIHSGSIVSYYRTTSEGGPVEGLENKVIIFAGAGGIATATAEFLGASGARLVVGDVIGESAERTAQAAINAGGDAIGLQFDIAAAQDVERFVDTAVSAYGRIDGLFNVAANISPEQTSRDTDVVDIELAAWQRSIDVNLTGYLLTQRYALPHMLAAGGGAVVNTISGAVYAGGRDKVGYQATKAGVTALTRHVARRYGKDGIRANTVSPGLVLTETAAANLSEEFQNEVLAASPSRRLGRPADIGAAVAFLLSDLAEWITGQVLCVDGGDVMRA